MPPPRRNRFQWIPLYPPGDIYGVRPRPAFHDDDLSDCEDFLDDEEEDHYDACVKDIEEPFVDDLSPDYDKFLQVLRSSETAQAKGSKLADIMVAAYLTKHAPGTINPPHWSAWMAFHHIAELVPRHHPWQDSLLECVTQLMHRPDYRWKKHGVFWDAMNEMPHPLDNFDHARNYNKFLVGFTRAHYELLVEHDIASAAAYLMHIVLMQTIVGLETPQNEEEPLSHWKRDVLNAADWFIEDAYRILKFMFMRFKPIDGNNRRTPNTDSWASLGPLAEGELSTEDPLCCVKRWKFWKRRFAAILDEGLIDDDDHARHIRRALRAMRRAERDMKLAYERAMKQNWAIDETFAVKMKYVEVFDMLKAILQSPESLQAKGETLANTILDLHATSNEVGYGHEQLGTVWGAFWNLVLWERRCGKWQDALVECVTQLKRRRGDAWEAISTFMDSIPEESHDLDVDFHYDKGDSIFEVDRILNRLNIRFKLAGQELGFRFHTGLTDRFEKVSKIGPHAVRRIIIGLESPQPSIEDVWRRRVWELQVLEAVDWLVEWAEGVYFMTGPCDSIEICDAWSKKRRWVAPRLCGADQHDPDTPAFRLQRWASWKSRLTTIFDRQLFSDNPHNVKRIRLAIRRMNRAEETGDAARENRLAAEALPGNPYDDGLPGDTDDAATSAGGDEGHEKYFWEDDYYDLFCYEETSVKKMGNYSLTTGLVNVVERMRDILDSPRTIEAMGKRLADYIVTQSYLPKFQNFTSSLWGCFLLIATEVPGHHKWHNGLLECLESLRNREDSTWWLNSFSDQLWTQYEKMGWESGLGNQQMSNLTSFVTRFKRAEYKHGLSINPDEARENLAPFVLADLMQGVELSIGKLQEHHKAHGFKGYHSFHFHQRRGDCFSEAHQFWEGTVWRAADWLIECAEEIYNLVTSDYEVVQCMENMDTSEMSPPLWIWYWLGEDEFDRRVDDCSLKRWAFWKKRFAAILESNLLLKPRVTNHVRRAIECMDAAEQRAGGNAEEMGQGQEQGSLP